MPGVATAGDCNGAGVGHRDPVGLQERGAEQLVARRVVVLDGADGDARLLRHVDVSHGVESMLDDRSHGGFEDLGAAGLGDAGTRHAVKASAAGNRHPAGTGPFHLPALRLSYRRMGNEERAEGIVIDAVTKMFGDFCAVDDVSFTIREGEFFTMLGPSGCGKTTTLRMIAGFEEPTDGPDPAAGP